MNKKIILQKSLAVSTRVLVITLSLAAIITFGVYQFLVLQKAHSTFEEYYKFRGCTRLIEKTNTYGICNLSSGQVIKILEINSKWYLEGDGPRVW